MKIIIHHQHVSPSSKRLDHSKTGISIAATTSPHPTPSFLEFGAAGSGLFSATHPDLGDPAIGGPITSSTGFILRGGYCGPIPVTSFETLQSELEATEFRPKENFHSIIHGFPMYGTSNESQNAANDSSLKGRGKLLVHTARLLSLYLDPSIPLELVPL
jgi:hypothetical protein